MALTEGLNGKISRFMKVTGKIMRRMALAYINGLMVVGMKASLRIIRCMAKGRLIGAMARSMKVNFMKTKGKAMEFFNGQTELGMKEDGLTTNKHGVGIIYANNKKRKGEWDNGTRLKWFSKDDQIDNDLDIQAS